MCEATAQHIAYDWIKERILTLRLRPFTRLKASDLATGLDMSRTPVREALVRLEQDGLVRRVESGGFEVRAISLKEIVDTYRVREALEVEAALEALKNLDDGSLEKLARILRRAGQLLLKPAKYAEFVSANREFHAEIVKASNNAIFDKIMQPINDRVRLVGAMLISLRSSRRKEVLEENEAIFHALKSRDPERVEQAVREHVWRARDHATALFAREQQLIFMDASDSRSSKFN